MSERDIFIAALQKDDPAQRRAYLDEVCAGRLMLTHEGGYSPTYVPLCGVEVLSELSGVPVDVIPPLYQTYETMPEHAVTAVQQAVVDEVRAAHQLI